MARVEKSVFISYRRTNVWTAVSVYQNLTSHGYDVFLDYTSNRSGDWYTTLLENIRARAHFLVLLTPSALERRTEGSDVFRQEIGAARDAERNIVPLMLEGFKFDAKSIRANLTGKLTNLNRYQGITLPLEYFAEAMDRLRSRFLSVPVDSVSHPPSAAATEASEAQRVAVAGARSAGSKERSAEAYFERAFAATDPDEKIRLYTRAIDFQPDFSEAINNRGLALREQGDLATAIEDFDQAVALSADNEDSYYNRGIAREAMGDRVGAMEDFDRAIRIKPDFAFAYGNRGSLRQADGDFDGALEDFDQALRLQPDNANDYNNRGYLRQVRHDLDAAIQDYDRAIQLDPEFAAPYDNRGIARESRGDLAGALEDFKRYRDLGGDSCPHCGQQDDLEKRIRNVQDRLQALR